MPALRESGHSGKYPSQIFFFFIWKVEEIMRGILVLQLSEHKRNQIIFEFQMIVLETSGELKSLHKY